MVCFDLDSLSSLLLKLIEKIFNILVKIKILISKLKNEEFPQVGVSLIFRTK